MEYIGFKQRKRRYCRNYMLFSLIIIQNSTDDNIVIHRKFCLILSSYFNPLNWQETSQLFEVSATCATVFNTFMLIIINNIIEYVYHL